MTLKSILSTAATVGLGAVLFALPVQSQTTTLRLTTCFPKNHDFVEAFFATFYNPLNAKKASVKIRWLGGPEVTPRKLQASSLKRGLVDMILCPAPYYGGQLSEARLPGAHNQSYDTMRKNGALDMLQEAWGKGLNARILAWGHFGGQKFYIYTRFKPTLSSKTGIDFTGKKMRSTGLYNALFKAMGATPINISPGDVYTSLERGLVQGLAWPWGSVGKYGWERFLKYRIEPSFFGATMMTLINKGVWDKLTKEQQDLLTKQARFYEKESDKLIVEKGHIDDAKLKAAGVTIIKLKGAVREAYINTIYNAKWAENDSKKYIVDYKKLKSLMYKK